MKALATAFAIAGMLALPALALAHQTEIPPGDPMYYIDPGIDHVIEGQTCGYCLWEEANGCEGLQTSADDSDCPPTTVSDSLVECVPCVVIAR